MKVKLCLFLVTILILSQTAHSSGALRYVLPFLSSITGTLKEGEIAYDEVRKSLVYKNDTSVVTLANEIVYNESKQPRIISTTFRDNPADLPLIYSDVSPGNIKIKGKVFKNSSAVSCAYTESSPVVSLGFFDGSSKPVPSPGVLHLNPMYLYLVENGTGFSCVLSFNIGGPVSSIVNGKSWMRVQTIAGGILGSKGAVYKTINNRTHISDTGRANFGISIDAGDNVAYGNDLIFTQSMESIFVKSVMCSGSEYVEFAEKIDSPAFTKKSKRMVDRFVTTFICNTYGAGTTTGNFEYLFNSGSRRIYISNSGFKTIDFSGWTELTLTSI